MYKKADITLILYAIQGGNSQAKFLRELEAALRETMTHRTSNYNPILILRLFKFNISLR